MTVAPVVPRMLARAALFSTAAVATMLLAAVQLPRPNLLSVVIGVVAGAAVVGFELWQLRRTMRDVAAAPADAISMPSGWNAIESGFGATTLRASWAFVILLLQLQRDGAADWFDAQARDAVAGAETLFALWTIAAVVVIARWQRRQQTEIFVPLPKTWAFAISRRKLFEQQPTLRPGGPFYLAPVPEATPALQTATKA